MNSIAPTRLKMFQRWGMLALTALCGPVLHADDGGQLYTTYCAACHGANGEGALNGQFPPLAGSPWPLGAPDRGIKIVLSGLHGEIDVNGHTWNLEMPPQGAALSDEQIAAVLSYIRGSWGNQNGAVEPAQVKTVRAATSDRTQPWTPAELMKLHSLERKPPLTDLLSYVYDGEWKNPPDFTALKPVAVEEEHAGLISLKKTGRKDRYGVVWEGGLTLPADAEYEFHFDADDGGRLLLDGQKLIEIGGIGPIGSRAKETAAKFTAGKHKLRVEYYEFAGNEEIRVAWRKKGDKQWTWLSDQSAPRSKWPEIPVVAKNGKTAIYRNFIKGTTARSIGVGFPNALNLAWSIDHLAPELVWSGSFMDGGHHWTDRGQGAEPPAGERVVKLSNVPSLPEGTKFRGYQLDPAGNPTFLMQFGKAVLRDGWEPALIGGKPALQRTLSIKDGATELLLSDKLEVKSLDSQTYAFGDLLRVQAASGKIITRDGKAFLALAAGQTATLTYSWK